jgi:hypothetical protein
MDGVRSKTESSYDSSPILFLLVPIHPFGGQAPLKIISRTQHHQKNIFFNLLIVIVNTKPHYICNLCML